MEEKKKREAGFLQLSKYGAHSDKHESVCMQPMASEQCEVTVDGFSQNTQFAAGEERSIWLLRNWATSLWMKISLQMFVWLRIFPWSLFTGQWVLWRCQGDIKPARSQIQFLPPWQTPPSTRQNIQALLISTIHSFVRSSAGQPPHSDRFLCWKHRLKSENVITESISQSHLIYKACSIQHLVPTFLCGKTYLFKMYLMSSSVRWIISDFPHRVSFVTSACHKNCVRREKHCHCLSERCCQGTTSELLVAFRNSCGNCSFLNPVEAREHNVRQYNGGRGMY